MICQQTRTLKHAYADGELDVLRAAEYEEHLRQCPACRRALENVRSLKSALKSDVLYFKAPATLEQQVRSALRPADLKPTADRPFWWAWLKLGIPLGAAALLALVLTLALPWPATNGQLVHDLTSSHVRSLMAGHLTDVASSDQHTVKPWFTGRLDFSPLTIDLAEHGFPLVGGRLDYIGNRTVAALVYRRRQHVINLFMWPDTSGRTARIEELTGRQGYNLVRWSQAGMALWAVSDLNVRELSDFARLIQAGQ